MTEILRRYSNHLAIAFTLLILSLCLWRDYILLFQTPLATGIDGYYYVLQINRLISKGQFYFPTRTPIVLYLLSLLRFLTQDAVVAIKLGGMIFHLLLSVGVFCLIKKLTLNNWFGLCALAIANLSGLHLYMIGEFLSNLGALTFIVWSGFFFLKAIQAKSKGWFTASFICLLLAVLSHRSALPLIFLISFTGLLAYILVGEKLNSRNKKFLLSITLLIIVSPLILAWQTVFNLPDSLTTEFLKVPQLPFNKTTLPECLALAIISLTVVLIYFLWSKVRQTASLPGLSGISDDSEIEQTASLFYLSQNKAVGITLGAVVLWNLFVTLNPFLNHQTGFTGITGRLSSLSYLQTAVAVPLLLFCSK